MRTKKRKISLKKISLWFIIVLIFLGLILFKQCKKTELKLDNSNNDVGVEEKQEYKLSLIMAGDALINDYLYEDARRQAEGVGYNFIPYLKLVKERVSQYDLAYYNQETILGGSGLGLSSYPAFNSPYEVGDAMIDAGFNLVSLATNHTLDRGEKAILNSREYWNKQDEIVAVGSYSSFDEKEILESKVYEKNHIKYAILNYTYGTNGISIPSGKEYLVNVWDTGSNYEKYKEKVISDISKVRDKVDVVIIAMHWGIEYTHKETDIQRKVAKFLADNGVDIIIGTHPHVIQPVEWIDDTLVFYSLGNFISSQTSDSCTNYKCSIGLLSSLDITKSVDDNKIRIDNIQNDLIYTYHNNYRNYLVIPFSNSSIKDYLSNYVEVYNNYSKIIDSSDDRISVLPIGVK